MMKKISVIMPVYNGEKHLVEAIESVLKQSFKDFEFIIIDDGSTDSSLSIIRSFQDDRIVLIENKHNFIKSLNLGLQKATGKYIARMDADDIMHIDRLKIQYAIMEEEPAITVCSSWAQCFGEAGQLGIIKSLSGIIQNPIIQLIQNNIFTHPTVMLRNDFLKTHSLQYENYPCAEDYKLWIEIAKLGGVFFIESQPLLFYRISKDQVTFVKGKEMKKTDSKIKKELINYLIEKCFFEKSYLHNIYKDLINLESKGLVSPKTIINLFYEIFTTDKILNP